ncbi:Atu4866 domain-containing protein [Chelativorans sp. AA-79]|uniref:Atu4866 domain-containing protein n=1 Tax=Chelativorans sp. AA-79 TaxID=3028735 RepID=UPI0023F85886|nr:Atu4866 domain-containing protein [Chelativorans sp. AA-79]WEX10954.1 Atu4866 domain-containing protein [Chelativorans sp. AA-79]
MKRHTTVLAAGLVLVADAGPLSGQENVREQEGAKAPLELQSGTDALTGNGNRPFFRDGGGPEVTREAASHPYIGMWVTGDGHIRHELLPNGRYVEARGNRERAYEGRYEITGDHIEYWDDTGFTADGDFIDGVLHHAGMILYRSR